MKIFRTCPCCLLGLPVQITTHVLLCESGETGIDPVNLIGGEERSFGKDLLQVLHGDGTNPSESFNVEDSPRVREDDGPVKPKAICAPQQLLELSHIAV